MEVKSSSVEVLGKKTSVHLDLRSIIGGKEINE